MFYSVIEQLCKEKQINFKVLAKELEITPTAISRWKKYYPKSEILKKIADYFDVSTDFLLGRSMKVSKDILDNDLLEIQKAREKMTYKEKKKMMKILKTIFEDHFNEIEL